MDRKQGTVDELIDRINERHKITEDDGNLPTPKKKSREDFSQAAARIVREATNKA